jgi:hypothetical protein
MHPCPLGQPPFAAQPTTWPKHTPLLQISGASQSLSEVHVHWAPWCVALHVPLGPHWLSEEHVVHVPPTQA